MFINTVNGLHKALHTADTLYWFDSYVWKLYKRKMRREKKTWNYLFSIVQLAFAILLIMFVIFRQQNLFVYTWLFDLWFDRMLFFLLFVFVLFSEAISCLTDRLIFAVVILCDRCSNLVHRMLTFENYVKRPI